MNQDLTALYERLSHDDELQGESNSISGTFDREGLKAMLAEVEKGNVGTIIIKDMSRLAERFIALVDKYQDFEELTTYMLNEFVEKILVHERDRKGSQQTTQEAAPELSEAEGKRKAERIRRQNKRKKESRDRGEEGSNPAGRYCQRCVCSGVDAFGCRTKERGCKRMKELKTMVHDEKNGLDYILVGDYSSRCSK